MKKKPYPILEFDENPQSILEPSELVSVINAPECCVICFFAEVIQHLIDERQARFLVNSKSEMGD